jgi:hypothetical protein
MVEGSADRYPEGPGAMNQLYLQGCELQVTDEGNTGWTIATVSCPEWTLPDGSVVAGLVLDTHASYDQDGLRRDLTISGSGVIGALNCTISGTAVLYCL